MSPRPARGAYRGACRIDSDNMRERVKTGKSQAEFAMLCGISERTLRSWEAGKHVSITTHYMIRSKLQLLTRLGKPGRPVKYRDSYTGDTWSGRGLMPRWLKARMEQGRHLAEFAVAP